MDTAILSSTFLLTLLLLVGLLFFIRASTKDRTERTELLSDQDEATLMNQLKEYFRSRSYRVSAVDSEKNQVNFEGFVRPSWFLAIFLTFLAFVGFGCLSLVLSFLVPSFGQWFLILVLLSPLSGLFYWKKAGRLEKVSLKIENEQEQLSSKITVIAHRDEVLELQKALRLKTVE